MSQVSQMPGPNASLERYVIPNLRNACRVLKLLRGHPGGLKAADLARGLGIPVTTTMRITATLQNPKRLRQPRLAFYSFSSLRAFS